MGGVCKAPDERPLNEIEISRTPADPHSEEVGLAGADVTSSAKHAPACGAKLLAPRTRRTPVHSDLALKLTADLLWTGLLVCLPVLAITMAVGLVVSVLQVLTQ